MRIEAALPADLPAVHALLEHHQLPRDGVDDQLQTMVVAREGSRVVGVAALEVHADGALLRSVAVDASVQGQRLGHRLTEAALDMAKQRGVEQVFLLTTTAERFFASFGFETIPRAAVPASVQTSVEFRFACPASATVMRKRLRPNTFARGSRQLRS
jgi:amino-acid N-acetyltransferase